MIIIAKHTNSLKLKLVIAFNSKSTGHSGVSNLFLNIIVYEKLSRNQNVGKIDLCAFLWVKFQMIENPAFY